MVSKTRDVVLDYEAGPETGWAVKTDQKDTSILLIGGLKDLARRTVIPLLKDTVIFINKQTRFNYKNTSYTIYARAQKGKPNGNDGPTRNYQIWIEAVIDQKLYKQLLASSAQTDYEMLLIFAGDIDGDGIPDLIINTSGHENTVQPTLYLSKPAAQGQLLKVMGLHTIVGC
ncbi:hypothetical protein GCM10028827_13830 [Mucilaginibacter myungsuensis]